MVTQGEVSAPQWCRFWLWKACWYCESYKWWAETERVWECGGVTIGNECWSTTKVWGNSAKIVWLWLISQQFIMILAPEKLHMENNILCVPFLMALSLRHWCMRMKHYKLIIDVNILGNCLMPGSDYAGMTVMHDQAWLMFFGDPRKWLFGICHASSIFLRQTQTVRNFV